jgi:UDP-N-acetyl-D-mannosaminuronic acid transferase (WecB/TagA/CpsF family)
MHQRVFETPATQEQKEYTKALSKSDYLFADGIALQVFNKIITNKRTENLNGTDFIPYFIKRILRKEEDVHIALRTVFDPTINK